MFSNYHRAVLHVVIPFFLFFFAIHTVAQTPPSPNPALKAGKPAVTLHFEDYLNVLHQKTELTFVAEDAPMNPVPQEAIPLNDLRKMGTTEAVETVARKFDYTAEIKNNLCYLTKRYTAQTDLPCVTIDECRLALEDTEKIFSLLPVRRTMGDRVVPFSAVIATLTEEQRQQLPKGLPVASLTQAQREQVRNYVMFFYVGMAGDDVNPLRRKLVAARKAEFQYQSVEGVRTFGYFFAPDGARYFQGFSFGGDDGDNIKDKYGHVLPRRVTTKEGAWSTLGAVVGRMNDPTGHTLYQVDEALANKRATIVGSEGVSARRLMIALAAVYGLRIKVYTDTKSEKEIVRLTRPAFPQLRGVADVPTAVRAVLPAPLLRATEAQETDPKDDSDPRIAEMLRKLRQGKEWEKRQADRLTRSLRESSDNARFRILEIEVAQQLRLAYQNRTGKAKDTPLLFTELTKDEQNIFAIVLMTHWLQTMDRHYNLHSLRLPFYIAEFDKVYLQGGPYKDETGTTFYNLSLCRKEGEEGNMHTLVGASRLPYDPK